MNSLQKIEFCAGLLLLFSSAEAGARSSVQDGSEALPATAYLDAPNILELLILDEGHGHPSTALNGSYLAALVIHQDVQANWVQSDLGIQLYFNGERLDPRRYQVDWKVVVSPYSVARAKFLDSSALDFGQKIQIETPLNSLNGRLIGAIEIEARVSDRERPEKAPEVIVQTLRDMLANGRDGL